MSVTDPMYYNTKKDVCKINFPTGNSITPTNIECLLTNGKKIDSLPTSETPYAIIKYGPTGSGKGSEVVQKEIELLGVPLDQYAVFEIDSLVESVKNYRNKTLRIKKTHNNAPAQYSKDQMFKNLTNAYFSTRKQLNAKLTETINYAIQNRKHFIFETTGTYFGGKNPIEWLIESVKKMGNNQYKIVLIYPLVTPNELKKRVELRAQKQATRVNKPLYRAINTSTIEPATLYAKQNLSHFILPQVYVKNIHKLVLVWNE